MPVDTIANLRSDLTDRLEEVAEERERLERDLRDRLEPLKDEERRLRAALNALGSDSE